MAATSLKLMRTPIMRDHGEVVYFWMSANILNASVDDEDALRKAMTSWVRSAEV
jgi:hypothetical protein